MKTKDYVFKIRRTNGNCKTVKIVAESREVALQSAVEILAEWDGTKEMCFARGTVKLVKIVNH